jgi:XTP/dITP diphosphohydrolase/tetrapyrrole methylase family protein/MazG family protein
MPHDIPSAELPPVDRLRRIMHLLRAPGGCPWDAEQTHESLVKHLIEEAYEVAAAIRGGNRDEIIDELGDLLLQPVFHAEIASGAAEGGFDLDDIATAICEKLIRRHPHVFGDATADSPDAVLTQWELIKATEKGSLNLDGLESKEGQVVPEYLIKKANDGLPALMAAGKIQGKAATVGFDWPDLPPVIGKVREEIDEVVEAMSSGCDEKVAEEIGDLLFAVVNLARKAGHEAEVLLHAANGKFVKRLQAVEDVLCGAGLTLESASFGEMDAAWDKVKAGRTP